MSFQKRALLVLLATAAVWTLLSCVTFLPVRETRWMGEPNPAWSIMVIADEPWLVGLLLLQLIGAIAWSRAGWIHSHQTRDITFHLACAAAVGAFAFLMLGVLKQLWQDPLTDVDRRLLTIPRLAAACGAGSLAAGVLVLLLRRAGSLPAFGVTYLTLVFTLMGTKAPAWRAALGDLFELRSVAVLTALAPIALAFWLWYDEYELREPGADPAAQAIRLPRLAAGVLPFVLVELILNVALHGPKLANRLVQGPAMNLMPRRIEGFLETWRIPMTVGLLIPCTAVALWMLYPRRRLVQTYGAAKGSRVADALYRWPSPFLLRCIGITLLLQAGFELLLRSGLDLGLARAEDALVLGAGLPALVAWIRERIRFERAGSLVPVARVLGDLSARVCREKLARSGIPMTTEAWTLHAIQPITVPCGGEVVLLVPAEKIDEAVRVLKEHLEYTGDVAAEVLPA